MEFLGILLFLTLTGRAGTWPVRQWSLEMFRSLLQEAVRLSCMFKVSSVVSHAPEIRLDSISLVKVSDVWLRLSSPG